MSNVNNFTNFNGIKFVNIVKIIKYNTIKLNYEFFYNVQF